MRSDAKASTAGSKQRNGTGRRKPALLLLAVAACVAALAVVVGSASGSTTRFLQETFGSSAQPSFPADHGMAFDQGAGHLYVIDSTADTLQRFNANGIAANFSALGSNEIDGEGTGDETPLGHLAFESNRQREQVAIDESGEATDGNVYVTQAAKDVVDIFNGEGEYLGALSESTEGGAFGEPCGVAVDGEGTVYVGDRGDDRIHVFDPAGAVPVNGDSAATSFATLVDPCTMAAGAGATEGFLFVARSTAATLSKLDATSGELKYEIATGASTVSVDPTTGHVFAARNTGSSSTVDEYDASGATEASLVSSFKPGSTVEGIALSSASEQVYVARSSTENVEVYGPAKLVPDVVTEEPSANTGTRATFAGTVNPDGVELDECFFEWAEGFTGPYTETTPCAETPAEIGTGTSPVAVHADLTGLTPQGIKYHYRLVAKNPESPAVNGSNWGFTTPTTVVTTAATGVTSTEATLNGTVNPDTATISACVFEWGPLKESFEEVQPYPDSVPCLPGPGGIGSGESPVAVEADLSGLHVGATYAYRVKATYPTGPTIAAQQTVQTAGPRIAASWAADVLFSEAKLKAEIDPEGQATTYHFDYGTTEAYGSETPEISVGSDSATHLLTRYIDGLTPGTTYHYRAVASSGVAVNVGPDRTFTTYKHIAARTDCPNQVQRYGAGANLPDCRAYEMVTPVDKHGGEIIAKISKEAYPFQQSSLDGNRATYSSPWAFADAKSSKVKTQYIGTRGSDGWSTHAISAPQGFTVSDPDFSGEELWEPFQAFTPDLSTAWFWDANDTPLLPGGLEDHFNLYQLDTTNDSLELLTNGGLFGPVGPGFQGKLHVQGYTKDLSHVYFSAGAALTPDAPVDHAVKLYDFSGGVIKLVSIRPGGTPTERDTGLGSGGGVASESSVEHAVSDDGSRVFFGEDAGKTYVRIDGETTLEVPSSGGSTFVTATPDGSKVLYLAGGGPVVAKASVYEADVDAGTFTKLAGQSSGIVGASDDFSYVYFVSKEDLAAGATAGERNLYLRHDGAITFIATVDAEDTEAEPGYFNRGTGISGTSPVRRTSHVSADGRRVVFQSLRPATGFDNRDARTGEPVAEVYLYDAPSATLSCISCRPSGDRATGARIEPGEGHEHLAAGSVPWTWWATNPRKALSADGRRVFFDSFDALTPADANGTWDVYQWEERGTGDCEDAGGCVRLISSGTSAHPSKFFDASADGETVFFETVSSLDPRDPGLNDIYAARVDGGYDPPSPPSECFGDSCQSAPPAPLDPTPSSAAFRGAGDPVPRRSCSGAARRAVKLSSRAKRLRRAAKRSPQPRRTRRLHRKSVRFAKRAKRLSRTAARCRRANRRASR